MHRLRKPYLNVASPFRTHQPSDVVVVQVYLRLNVPRFLSRIQKQLRELDSEVHIVRTSAPLPSARRLQSENRLSLQSPVRLMTPRLSNEPRAFVIVLEFAIDAIVHCAEMVLGARVGAQRLHEAAPIDMWIATARHQTTLTAGFGDAVRDSGR